MLLPIFWMQAHSSEATSNHKAEEDLLRASNQPDTISRPL